MESYFLNTEILVISKIPLFQYIEKSEAWIILRLSSKTQFLFYAKRQTLESTNRPLNLCKCNQLVTPESLRILLSVQTFWPGNKRNTTALKWTASDSPFTCDETINKKWRQTNAFKPNLPSVFYSLCPQVTTSK